MPKFPVIWFRLLSHGFYSLTMASTRIFGSRSVIHRTFYSSSCCLDKARKPKSSKHSTDKGSSGGITQGKENKHSHQWESSYRILKGAIDEAVRLLSNAKGPGVEEARQMLLHADSQAPSADRPSPKEVTFQKATDDDIADATSIKKSSLPKVIDVSNLKHYDEKIPDAMKILVESPVRESPVLRSNEAARRVLINNVIQGILRSYATKLAFSPEVSQHRHSPKVHLFGPVDYAITSTINLETLERIEPFKDPPSTQLYLCVAEAKKGEAIVPFQAIAPAACIAAQCNYEHDVYAILSTGDHWYFYYIDSGARLWQPIEIRSPLWTADKIGPIVRVDKNQRGFIDEPNLMRLRAVFMHILDDIATIYDYKIREIRAKLDRGGESTD